MEKVFFQIQEHINTMKILAKIKYTYRFNQMEKLYYSLNLSIDENIEGEMDTEYIEFVKTGEKISLTWNISRLRNYIRENHSNDYVIVSLLQIQKELGELAFKKQIEAIEKEKSKSDTKFVTKREPIYVMAFIPTRQYYILDGKHRLYEAHLKRTDIECYYLNSDMLVPFLINEDQRRLYRFIKEFFFFCEEIGLFITNV